MSKVYAIIVAAGKSQRFGEDKLWADLAGQPVLTRTIQAFLKNENVDEVVVVTKDKLSVVSCQLSVKIVDGGKSRQQSSFNGLKSIQAKADDIILFHNGANPLVTQKEINSIIEATKKEKIAVVGQKVKNTVKELRVESGALRVEKTLNRNNLYEVQTPQGIRYDLAIQAFEQAKKDKFEGTDDVQLVERLGYKVKIVPVSSQNFKITKKSDLKLANLILNQSQSKRSRLPTKRQILVGIGQDSHQFDTKEKPLILGGYKINKTGGLKANSDGDVIIHALCNALSSSIGGFSLSNWADKMCKNGIKDSRQYLAKIQQDILDKNYKINNISIALEAGKPKLEKHLPKIQKTLAKILEIKSNQIGITVTSGESLTEFGKGKGIQCFCFVSLKQT